MSKWIEEWGPTLASVITVIFLVAADITVFKIYDFGQILNATISLCAILIGFLGTMVSIMVVTKDSKFVRLLQRFNLVDKFVGYFTRCFLSGILSCVLSLVLMGVLNRVESYYWYLFITWSMGLAYFVASAHITIGIMLEVLGSVLREK